MIDDVSLSIAPANLLVQEWGTGLLADISLFGPMVVVELPLLTLFEDRDSCTFSDAEQLQNLLFYEHNIEVGTLGGPTHAHVCVCVCVYMCACMCTCTTL